MSWSSSRSTVGWPPGDGSVGISGRAGSLTSSAAESIRTPATPRSNQNRRISSCSRRTSGWSPVEVGLLGREEVEVPLAGRSVRIGRPCPRRTGEVRGPARRHLVAVVATTRVEPEARALGRSGTGGQGGLEPRVLVRDVVRDDVDDRPDAELERLADQALGLTEGAEGGIDRPIVRHVVAAVCHRRRVPRREPHGVDAQVTQVGELRANAGKVADPVAVRVGEAPDVDLVDDRVSPPLAVAPRLLRIRNGCAGSSRRRQAGQNPFGQVTFPSVGRIAIRETVRQRR